MSANPAASDQIKSDKMTAEGQNAGKTDAYKDTVFLPRTDFPMRAGLPRKEPEILEHWARLDLYNALRKMSHGRERFVLHDGPPYANGNIHIGHAQNKILKDVVARSQQLLGKDSVYVPGWDCHGLPIEWKIEERYRAEGRDKDAVPVNEFRAECRAFAQHWVDVQREEFKRLGVIGDWDNPYMTMTFAAEAQITAEIHKFVKNGGLYQGSKPVLWSVVEKTALADAEVEYHEHKSTTIWVRFPVVTASHPALEGTAIVIWTTTPWTIPGNRAVAAGEEIGYGVYEVTSIAAGSLARVGEKLVVATALADDVQAQAKIEGWTRIADLTGAEIAGTLTAHPWRGQGYDQDTPVYLGDFVTDEAGTGFVHIAPGHGEDDYHLGLAQGLDIPHTVGPEGVFYDHVPIAAGAVVYDANGKPGNANGVVIKALVEADALVAKGSLRHSYPHSWRSKAPLIFRNTAQWFISMETNDLREKALAAIEATRWVPGQSKNRIRSMIETRPDWCVSRQRAWGVPIALFVRKADRSVLDDPAVLERIVEVFREEGSDAWFARDPQDFLGNAYDKNDFEQVTDIVEVWFESGSTHSYVLEPRDDLSWPADLYLEGSDQHRGWFHSSLLESCGTRGRAPYKAVLTHGFALDAEGKKMSKSLGNTIAPQDVIAKSGADILRLWVVAADYSEDVRIGQEILDYQADVYRRFRNTLRYLLGALDGFNDAERVPRQEMPELERWVLTRVHALDRLVRQSIDDFDFNTMFVELHNFCAVELSAFYFDIRKDCLYCDAPSSSRRRAARTVMAILFDHLTAWLSPILCFTAEEAWLARPAGLGEGPESVHMRTIPAVPEAWADRELAEKWERLRQLRRVVNGALEAARKAKQIGKSLEAHPILHIDTLETRELLQSVDVAEIAITSGATVTREAAPEDAFRLEDAPGIAVAVKLAEGTRCERCWQVLPEVGKLPAAPDLCRRCADAVEQLKVADG